MSLAPSSAPLDVQGEALDSTSLRISWSPPPSDRQNGVIVSYKIYYAVASDSLYIDDGSVVVISVPASSRSYVLRGLKKWTLYRVWVRASTRYGEGPHTEAVLVQTAEDRKLIVVI